MKTFLQAMKTAGFDVKHGRGGAISFRAPAFGQTRYTRLRASTLGDIVTIKANIDHLLGITDPTHHRETER